MAEQRTVPVRTCLVCRRKAAKQELLRFTTAKGVVRQDHTGKAGGRGAYCCDSPECLQKFCSNMKRLTKCFRTPVCGLTRELTD